MTRQVFVQNDKNVIIFPPYRIFIFSYSWLDDVITVRAKEKAVESIERENYKRFSNALRLHIHVVHRQRR